MKVASITDLAIHLVGLNLPTQYPFDRCSGDYVSESDQVSRLLSIPPCIDSKSKRSERPENTGTLAGAMMFTKIATFSRLLSLLIVRSTVRGP